MSIWQCKFEPLKPSIFGTVENSIIVKKPASYRASDHLSTTLLNCMCLYTVFVCSADAQCLANNRHLQLI
jgi:hypothetical protein